ncbi:MAG TPA: YggT family protein [Sphaerochaetaceae bacterium]|jgi:YggT family protein|nr:YggT family protein [Sphaerochaetaceae bacterium]
MRELARIIAVLLSVYNLLIIVRILLHWFNPFRGEQSVGGFSDMLARIVDPYLNLFRRITILRKGTLDFTPLVALMVVNMAQRIFQTFAYTGRFSLGFTLATIVQSLWWSIGSLILGILVVLIGVRLYFDYKKSPQAIHYISMLESWLRRPLDTIHSLFFSKRTVSDRTLLWTSLATIIVLYVVIAILINLLVHWLAALPF